MAHTTARQSRPGFLAASIRTVFADWSLALERHRTFDRIHRELSMLSDRELSDIGLSRSQITDIAFDASRGR